MRSLALAAALFCGSNVLASEAPKEQLKGFSISSELNYEAPGRKIKTDRSLILPEDNQGWTTLVVPKDGVTLLGRMTEKTDKTIRMEYMVVDTTDQSGVIYTPAIIARLGEKAEIKVNAGDHIVAVSVLAKKTSYWTKE